MRVLCLVGDEKKRKISLHGLLTGSGVKTVEVKSKVETEEEENQMELGDCPL
jgi:hypothetical protein